MKKNKTEGGLLPHASSDLNESKTNKIKKRSNAKKVSVLLTPPAHTGSQPAAAEAVKPKISKSSIAKLPSKSIIFGTIHAHAVLYKKPLNTMQLAKELGVTPTQVVFLQELLDAMALSGDVKMNSKGAYTPTISQGLINGTIQTHKDGYGFLLNDVGEDIFIAERNMRGAWHGDKVSVRISGTARNGKQEGEVVEVLERKSTQVVGRLLNEDGVWLVSPDDVRLRGDILVAADELAGALVNQIVVVALKQYSDGQSISMGRVVEVLGNSDDAGMEIEIAVRKFDVPHVFSDETERQVAKLADEVLPKDWAGRVDLRDVPLVTIDGEDARDFDDAVFCEPIKEGRKLVGYRLLVAIADVSYYVNDKTPLNEDALTRSTSVYFPRRVVPMLPEKLSNGLCSLNPHLDRLCMVCDMVVGLDGQITAYQFYEAVMHSAARLTYNQVWEFLDQGTGIVATDFPKIAPYITSLYDLFKVFIAAREVRGAMEFETVETYIVCDEQGKIKEILPRTRNDAHRLIEECMLAANVCSAEFIESNERLGLYRNHEGPTPEKLEALRKNLRLVGLTLQGGDKPTPKDYAELMSQIHGRADASGLQTLMLRSMQQAVYAPDNLGHFGLAYSAYTHFTSPIRRYPDLLVHRTIKSILKSQRYTPMTEQIVLLEDTRKKRGWGDEKLDAIEKKHAKADQTHMVWAQLGTHASMCERRADEASRDVTNWLKCEYMKQFVGEVMAGKISSVTNFGAFVTLDDVYVDGLIHISELGKDYFEFDEVTHSLKGRSSGQVYRLQDVVQVQIAGVDSDTRRVDFKLVVEGAVGKGKRAATSMIESKSSKVSSIQKSGSAAVEVEKTGRSSRQRSRRKG